MAPEVAMGQTYKKSIDIWAIGIIMHIAITGGKHPFLTESDSYESFKEKLKNLEVVNPDPSLSELA
jgi:serine/threonine protein kinase